MASGGKRHGLQMFTSWYLLPGQGCGSHTHTWL